MGAVAGYGVAEAVVAAIAAGNDCAIVSHDLDLAREAALRLANAVANGVLPLQRLRDAHERVCALRAMGSAPLAVDALSPHSGIGRVIARRAMTRVRGDVRVPSACAHVISFEGASYDGVGDGVEATTVWSERGCVYSRCSLEPESTEIDAIVASLREGERLVIVTRRAHAFPAQACAVAALLAVDSDAVVVSAREPFDVPSYPRASNVLAAYGDDAASLEAAASVLFDGAPTPGRLPVEL
jgi:beta-N-acetylhexosaminidase